MYLKNIIKLMPYFETPRVNSPGGISSGGGSNSIDDNDNLSRDIAELNRDDDVEDKEDDKEVDDDKEKEDDNKEDDIVNEEDEDDDNKDNEDEEEEDDEKDKDGKKKGEKEQEEEEEVDPVKAATYKTIKAKYPNFFKEFPTIKNDLFALEAFRKTFPSVEEAQEAQGTVEAYNAIQNLVVEGKTGDLLSEIKDLGEGAYTKFVANFLPSLYSGDEKLYYKVVTPIVRSALKSIIKRGTEKGGKIGGTADNEGQNLINAALVAHLDLFGSRDIEKDDEPLIKKEAEDDPERKKFNEERNQYFSQKYNDLKGGIEGELKKTIMADIEKGLDPNNSLPPYVKQNLTRDIFLAVDQTLGKNENHLKAINALWEREMKAGFTGQNRQKIIQMVLSQARPLIPEVRQRLRQEALKGLRTFKGNNKGDKKNKDDATKRSSSNREQNGNPGRESGRKSVDWSRTSDEDFLNDKVNYK